MSLFSIAFFILNYVWRTAGTIIHIIVYIYLIILCFVYSISYCMQANQILPKLSALHITMSRTEISAVINCNEYLHVLVILFGELERIGAEI